MPRSVRGVRITSGDAWVTHAGDDLILRPGETALLAGRKDPAVASPIGETPLVLELLTRHTERPSQSQGIMGTPRIADRSW